MARLGLLPTDRRVQTMTNLQWLVMAKFSDLKESQDYRLLRNLLADLLGLSSEGGKFTPLSFFMHPEAPKQFAPSLSQEEEEQLLEESEQLLSEDTSQQLEEVFNMDIEGMLSAEERAKIEGMNLSDIEHKTKIGDSQ